MSDEVGEGGFLAGRVCNAFANRVRRGGFGVPGLGVAGD